MTHIQKKISHIFDSVNNISTFYEIPQYISLIENIRLATSIYLFILDLAVLLKS